MKIKETPAVGISYRSLGVKVPPPLTPLSAQSSQSSQGAACWSLSSLRHMPTEWEASKLKNCSPEPQQAVHRLWVGQVGQRWEG